MTAGDGRLRGMNFPIRWNSPDWKIALDNFHDVLNSLAALPNADVYVTGSNSRMLSSDIATQFRGRGWELRMRPLSFAEFLPAHGGDKADAWRDYETFGGLPQVVLEPDEAEKRRLLAALFEKTYLRDIVERWKVRDTAALSRVADMLCSAVGSLTNPTRLANAFSSLWEDGPSGPTVRKFLKYFEDAFLFQRADRWDVKGGRYLSAPSKWYATDVGLRNARTNFRQQEPAHLMENVLYNELVGRGQQMKGRLRGMTGAGLPANEGPSFICAARRTRHLLRSSTLHLRRGRTRHLL